MLNRWLKDKRIRIAGGILLVLLVLVLLLRPTGVRNYMILGMDNYGSLNDTGRSDVMMLVQLDFSRGRISAVTFARDMFLDRPSGRSAKINTIVRSNDEQTLAETIEQNFDIKIDGWFRVNFTTVIEMVDALGGVQLELTDKEVSYINSRAGKYKKYKLHEGECRLNGAQALVYARCRALDNDLGRGDRQTKLISAMAASAKHLTIGKLVNIYNTMKHAWTSSLSATGQFSLFKDVLWLKGTKVKRIGLPFDGYWHYGNDKSGNRGIFIQVEENRQMLHEALGM